MPLLRYAYAARALAQDLATLTFSCNTSFLAGGGAMEQSSPWMFELTHEFEGQVFKTHCGVREFSAPEGKCYVPYWVSECRCAICAERCITALFPLNVQDHEQPANRARKDNNTETKKPSEGIIREASTFNFRFSGNHQPQSSVSACQ
jgi:hypothetical protein